jgi:hypothetical protein
MLDIEVMRLLSGTQGLKDIQKMEVKIDEEKDEGAAFELSCFEAGHAQPQRLRPVA